MSFLIPLYIYPSNGGVGTFWSTLAAAPAGVGHIVANPGSGPGSVIDPNYRAAIDTARAAGIKVLGYVDTDYAAVAATPAGTAGTVEAQMNGWNALYAIDGFFFDRASNTVGDETYYAGLNAFAKALDPSWVTVNNYGTTAPRSFWGACDITVNTEAPEAGLLSDDPPLLGWELAERPESFCQIVYDGTAVNLDADVAMMRARNAGHVWIAQDALYQTEPSYWPALQNLLAAVGTCSS